MRPEIPTRRLLRWARSADGGSGSRVITEQVRATVLSYVDAVTDDETLPKGTRKLLQIEHAAHTPHGANLVKLADKIANLRDIRNSPPSDWSLQRRQEYFDWAKMVIDQVRGAHPGLEASFDLEYAQSPRRLSRLRFEAAIVAFAAGTAYSVKHQVPRFHVG